MVKQLTFDLDIIRTVDEHLSLHDFPCLENALRVRKLYLHGF